MSPGESLGGARNSKLSIPSISLAYGIAEIQKKVHGDEPWDQPHHSELRKQQERKRALGLRRSEEGACQMEAWG